MENLEQMSLEGTPNETASVVESKGAEIVSERRATAATLHCRILANAKMVSNSLVAIAVDLKTVRDGEYFHELGYESFDRYAELALGLKQRQARNYIDVLEKYGKDEMQKHADLGITKLVSMLALDAEDRQQLIDSGEAAELSTRSLNKKIEELQKQCAQMTFELDEKKDEADTFKRRYMEACDGASRDIDKLVKEKEELLEKINELSNRPIEVAVEKPSEEELEKIKKAAIEEAESKHAKELERVKKDLDRKKQKEIESVKTELTRKNSEQLAEHRKEIEKHEAEMLEMKNKLAAAERENSVLQANAKKPTGNKELLKYHFDAIQRAFNEAAIVIGCMEQDEAEKYKAGMISLADKCKAVIEKL